MAGRMISEPGRPAIAARSHDFWMDPTTHDRGDHPVASLAVAAARTRCRDGAQFPLQQVFRTMEARFDSPLAQTELLCGLGRVQAIDFAQHEHRAITVWERVKSGFQEPTQLGSVRLTFWIGRRRCNVRDTVLVA